MNKVNIYGGLGNQMFQYAFSIALNKRGKKSQLSFLEYLYYAPHNGFDLPRAFVISLPLHLRGLSFFLNYFGIFYKNKAVGFFLRKFIPWYQKKNHKLFDEKTEFQFDAKVFEQQNVFFRGTWQSELYFKQFAEDIKQQFVFKIPGGKENQNLIKQIADCNAVSIHIRRGDYLSKTWYASHGVIENTSYYNDAIELMESKVYNPRYFIFSDDITWAHENLKISNAIYVNHNTGKKSFGDMYLMSLCKHNIIANSTFSWWAAWLNKFENKIVIAPGEWLNTKDCNELYPKDWIRLQVQEKQ